MTRRKEQSADSNGIHSHHSLTAQSSTHTQNSVLHFYTRLRKLLKRKIYRHLCVRKESRRKNKPFKGHMLSNFRYLHDNTFFPIQRDPSLAQEAACWGRIIACQNELSTYADGTPRLLRSAVCMMLGRQVLRATGKLSVSEKKSQWFLNDTARVAEKNGLNSDPSRLALCSLYPTYPFVYTATLAITCHSPS